MAKPQLFTLVTCPVCLGNRWLDGDGRIIPLTSSVTGYNPHKCGICNGSGKLRKY